LKWYENGKNNKTPSGRNKDNDEELMAIMKAGHKKINAKLDSLASRMVVN
jgi:hypothetical protein